jgi:hypothetical protein
VATRHDLYMTRRWDADRAIARGSAPGTRGGRAVSFETRAPSRDAGAERAERLDPPPEALAVFRPSLRLLRPGQWIALTADVLEARDEARIWTLRRPQVQAVRVGPRIQFVGAGDRVLTSVPSVYRRAQVDTLARALGVRVLRA